MPLEPRTYFYEAIKAKLYLPNPFQVVLSYQELQVLKREREKERQIFPQMKSVWLDDKMIDI